MRISHKVMYGIIYAKVNIFNAIVKFDGHFFFGLPVQPCYNANANANVKHVCNYRFPFFSFALSMLDCQSLHGGGVFQPRGQGCVRGWTCNFADYFIHLVEFDQDDSLRNVNLSVALQTLKQTSYMFVV